MPALKELQRHPAAGADVADLVRQAHLLNRRDAGGAPATCLFKDFEELAKLATIDTYQSILGGMLQPEHLVETKVQVRPRPAAQAR
jgi:hypothetical protein